MLITPMGGAGVVTTFSVAALMAMLRFAVAVFAGVSPSLTVTVKLVVPTNGPVGVPVIAPFDKVRPEGSVPVVTDQLYGVAPPVACSVPPA